GPGQLVLGEEAQIAAQRSGGRVLALLDRGALERVHLALLLTGVDVLEQDSRLLLRFRALPGVFRGQEDVKHARPLRLYEIVQVRVVELLQLLLGDVGAGELRVELVLDELLDHRPFRLLAHRRALVVSLPAGLLREQLVADHVLEEFLLALDRVVARPQEGAGLVESLANLLDADPLVADFRNDRSGPPALPATGTREPAP